MGSLETGVSLSFKKDNSFRSLSSKIERQNSKPRSVFSRLLLPKKLGYSQWISILAIFSLFFGLFQLLLPLSVMERSSGEDGELVGSWDSIKLNEIVGELDFGESLRLEPKWVLGGFQRGATEVNLSHGSESIVRFGHRKPLLAMVFADLAFDSYQILMATVAAALQEIGYSIEVVSEENGPAGTVWSNMGVPVTIVQTKDHQSIGVDWLNYDGILVNSLEAKGIISCLMKEPFKSLPLIWTIHERILATRFSDYTTSGKTGILSDWKKSFKRATVVVFPDYALPIIYSRFDAGNYFVVPGAPAEACELGQFVNMNEERLHNEMDIKPDDFAIAIVGSHFLYKGLWLEHSLILQALKPLLAEFPSENSSSSRLKIFIVTGDATNNYTVAVEAISAGLKYPQDVVKHVVGDANADIALRKASLVIYGSFLEEHLFPNILTKALCFGKLIVAPRLSMIEKFVEDRVNGYLFTKEKIEVLTEIVSQVVSRGKLTPLARNVASIGKETAKNLMVTDAVEGYASLLESVLCLPSEVAPAKASSEIPMGNKQEWQWGIFKTVNDAVYKSRTLSSLVYLDKINHQNQSQEQIPSLGEDEAFLYRIWEEEKEAQMIQSRKRMLDEELKDRSGSTRGTWEDVYRNAKRADRAKNDLHERDDGELERTGQPLCIYEPYFGEGTWPFLHHTSLYRGIGLCSQGRRPGGDDIDASSRLPLLSNTYYRDLLGDMGALFSVAHRVDRVHKNAWIGFQSWRVTARKESLSKRAESALLNATQRRKNGDTFYFWSRMDIDPRNPRRLEFWSFCDAINAGNCRSAFSSTLKRMYGINQSWDSLPPMPFDGDTWSVMHTWALPTRSFLEYVMFARMFVDAMDAQMYNEHHESGLCYLSPAKDKHCYSRVLELLINVWAYHSARRMVYINPETGVMQEHHMLKARKGQMWVKWFSFNTLKKMDEDLAEEFDSDPSKTRRLWPSTGEVFWQGMLEKERMLRLKEKEKRRRKSKDKLVRMRRRTHQKVLGKYVKPPPEEPETGNSSVSVER